MRLTITLICISVLFVCPFSANADMFNDSLMDETAAVIGGGVGQNATDDFYGQVTGLSPLVINGASQVNSGFGAVEVGDVIGRDLVSSGFNFTTATAEWLINIPDVPASYVANTFNLDATFNASTAFLGNTFSGTQPNALDFELFFDAVSQDTFQAQAGTHTAANLTGLINAGGPISQVRVVMSFPSGNSFNAGSEEFRLFAESLTVNYSYEFVAIPEPSSLCLLALLGLAGLVRRKR